MLFHQHPNTNSNKSQLYSDFLRNSMAQRTRQKNVAVMFSPETWRRGFCFLKPRAAHDHNNHRLRRNYLKICVTSQKVVRLCILSPSVVSKSRGTHKTSVRDNFFFPLTSYGCAFENKIHLKFSIKRDALSCDTHCAFAYR